MRFPPRRFSFSSRCFATAMRLTRNRADAEDLVQDTFVKVFRFSGQFTRGTNLRRVAVYDPSQHVAEPAPRRKPRHGRGR